MFRQTKGKFIRPSRFQYGAYDKPGVDLFATKNQEPVTNLFDNMKQLPIGSTATQRYAFNKVISCNTANNLMYRTIKHQVKELASARNKLANKDERLATEHLAHSVAAERDRQLVQESQRTQLYCNRPDLRDLKQEIERANTALSVKNQMDKLVGEGVDAKELARIEANEERRQLQQAIRRDEERLHKKSEVFRNALIAQMLDGRKRRAEQQEATRMEGKKWRSDYEQMLDDVTREEAEEKVRNRIRLRKSLDDCGAMQRAFREAHEMPPIVEVPLFDTLHEKTATPLQLANQKRKDRIQGRDERSCQVGDQLSRIKHKKSEREQIITDLLVSELKAKEDSAAYEELQSREPRRLRLRDEMLSQREQQYFYQNQREEFNKLLPFDDTCFMQRQYRQSNAKREAMADLNQRTYAAMSAMIVDDVQRAARVKEEDRQMRMYLANMQSRQDDRVTEERMVLLGREPKEVLYALRKGILRPEEIHAFELNRST